MVYKKALNLWGWLQAKLRQTVPDVYKVKMVYGIG